MIDDKEFFAPYTEEFYREHLDADHAIAYRRMAEVIIEEFAPKSVVDVGCGLGNLLQELENCGVVGEHPANLGIDCMSEDAWALVVPSMAVFLQLDLRHPDGSAPIGPYPLCISIEVAEHLPEESAPGYVKFLCSLSDTILFSAAFPGQSGTGHIHERSWSYWVDRFDEAGFEWDVETSRRIQTKLRGRVGSCVWYERLNVMRRKP